jgi:hypothetical protein
LANHNADTGFHFWDLQRWKREINDTRRMGARAMWYLPFQFGQRSRRDFEDMAPHWMLQREICRSLVEAGLEVGNEIPDHCADWIQTWKCEGTE